MSSFGSIIRRRNAELYAIESNLPSYLSLRVNGNGSLKGRIQIANGNAPQWVTEEGNLLRLVESDTDISVTLEAHPVIGTSINYTVFPSFDGSGGFLPFGLKLDKDTGELYGDAIQNVINTTDPEPFFEEDRPVWVSTNQNWDFGERENVEIQLEAESQTDSELVYFIRSGGLPFGLRLNRDNGLISGNTGEVVEEGDGMPVIEPKPRWYTPSGTILRTNEKETVDLQLNAMPRNGEQLTYFVIDGNMPWGLRLDRETGKIEGITGEVIHPEPVVIVDANAPIITTNTNLGNIRIGDEIDIQLDSQIYFGRELDRYVLHPYKETRTALPFGLRFTKDGRIHGRIDDSNHLGTYVFTVVVYDSVGLRSCDFFRFNIMDNV